MRNICLDIWMEQKSHPWRFAGKLLCVFLALFAGVLVSGFPFTFVIVLFALSGYRSALREEMQGIRGVSEMTYIVPRSVSEIKQFELQKNLLRAVFYACITILGYGITIGITANLSLDGGMLLLLLLLFTYQLIIFYHYYLFRLITIYQKKEHRYAAVELECCLAGIILVLLCYYKFTGYAVMAFMKKPLWCLGSVVVILLIFVIQCIQIKRCTKRLVIGDYRR